MRERERERERDREREIYFPKILDDRCCQHTSTRPDSCTTESKVITALALHNRSERGRCSKVGFQKLLKQLAAFARPLVNISWDYYNYQEHTQAGQRQKGSPNGFLSWVQTIKLSTQAKALSRAVPWGACQRYFNKTVLPTRVLPPFILRCCQRLDLSLVCLS